MQSRKILSFQCTFRLNSTHTTPILRATTFKKKVAIYDKNSEFTYNDLYKNSKLLSASIRKSLENNDNCRKRISFMCPNTASYTVAQWACWMAGATAIPLCKTHPASDLDYVVRDSQSSLIVTTDDYAVKLSPLVESRNLKMLTLGEVNNCLPSDDHYDDEPVDWSEGDAMLIYTSGTTGPPKGVLWTFEMIQAQNEMMGAAWGVSDTDGVLHTLPLHHVHGVVNALSTPLWHGASVTMLSEFHPQTVWRELLANENVNVFHAVPTIYAKLIEYYDKHLCGKNDEIKDCLQSKLRLMVSGSASLPLPIMQRWHEISGHWLLERYGMSEIGMALTNPLNEQRIPGAVGRPFPGVTVKLVSTSGGEDLLEATSQETRVLTSDDDAQLTGNLLVKGRSVFKGYWQNGEATKESFDNRWFLTGDTASYERETGSFRILGRTSVDIIKSGGYKISALDIERNLLQHPSIVECAVVGLPDDTWGEIVAVVAAFREDSVDSGVECYSKNVAELNIGEEKDTESKDTSEWQSPEKLAEESLRVELKSLQQWCNERMPSYHVPRVLKRVKKLDRNAMGKVNKKALRKSLFGL